MALCLVEVEQLRQLQMSSFDVASGVGVYLAFADCVELVLHNIAGGTQALFSGLSGPSAFLDGQIV